MTHKNPLSRPHPAKDTLGVILAGGLSQRMGTKDKFFLEHQAKSLLQHAIERANHQVHQLIISANGDLTRFDHYNLKVIPDRVNQQSGPLAGITRAMEWSHENQLGYKWLMSFASDTPYYPLNCVAKLKKLGEREQLDAITCYSGGQSHYVFTLWSMSILPQLQLALSEEQRALHSIIESMKHSHVEFSDKNTPFYNVNTPEDWLTISQLDHNK